MSLGITPTMTVVRLASGQTVPTGGGMLGIGKLEPIHDGPGPKSGSFAGIPVNTRHSAAKNDSTMHHARQPINHTFLVDIDQTFLPLRRKRGSSVQPDSLAAPLRGEKNATTISNGEFNKQDVCVIWRMSSHDTGIAYAVKNIGAFNMYMRTREAVETFGRSRNDGILLDTIDFSFLVQVGNVYKKNFNSYTAYSLEFSTAEYAVITDVFKACQLQPWHSFTKHTANEGDYVGFSLVRLRLEDTIANLSSTTGGDDNNNHDPYKKRRKLNNGTSSKQSDAEYFKEQRGPIDYIDPLVHDDYKDMPLYKKYHYKEFEEELNHEHFWQLVPWISPLASGPYQDFIQNQHFQGHVFPLGQVWETYGNKITQDKTEALHALYYLFPWLEKNCGYTGNWRERSLEHRTALNSNLTINMGRNSKKLYII